MFKQGDAGLFVDGSWQSPPLSSRFALASGDGQVPWPATRLARLAPFRSVQDHRGFVRFGPNHWADPIPFHGILRPKPAARQGTGKLTWCDSGKSSHVLRSLYSPSKYGPDSRLLNSGLDMLFWDCAFWVGADRSWTLGRGSCYVRQRPASRPGMGSVSHSSSGTSPSSRTAMTLGMRRTLGRILHC